MSFLIKALDCILFQNLSKLSDDELKLHNVRRQTVNEKLSCYMTLMLRGN